MYVRIYKLRTYGYIVHVCPYTLLHEQGYKYNIYGKMCVYRALYRQAENSRRKGLDMVQAGGQLPTSHSTHILEILVYFTPVFSSIHHHIYMYMEHYRYTSIYILCRLQNIYRAMTEYIYLRLYREEESENSWHAGENEKLPRALTTTPGSNMCIVGRYRASGIILRVVDILSLVTA